MYVISKHIYMCLQYRMIILEIIKLLPVTLEYGRRGWNFTFILHISVLFEFLYIHILVL